ncbi:MAG TPA: alpha/beta hydrolase [Gaiellaceae bacterium]|nr:alpha/beta hydrolase [Gaiellaceae bacterium]
MTQDPDRPRGGSRLPLALFAGASALVALHSAIDDFVAPEPGTGPGDHLLRGRVTLALLLAGVALFSLLKPGGKAALAAVLGALSLEATALAVADARAGGPRGEDWTGFVLGPVGLALLVLAAGLLWRSRRPGRWRWIRRAGIALAGTVAVYWLVLPVAVALLATHRPRATVEPAALGRPYEQVALRTSDGLRLEAWYVRSRNGAAVVSYPTRAGKLQQARMLVRHGYGVLLVDARGYDGSEGDPNVFGWDGAKDIDAAVAWLRRQRDVEPGRIGGIGFSVGGEMMLQAAAENPQLHAVVSDGAGARSVREDVLRGPRGWFSLPENAVQTAAVSVLSGTPPPPPLQELVTRISPRHLFLIWAGRSTAGEELNADYFRAARSPKALWKIDDAGHVGGFDAHPRDYERRVVGFFDRALGTA